MTQPSPPPKGAIYLFDRVQPPLPGGSYSVTATTSVSAAGAAPAFQQERFFDVVGPRWSVPQAMVAATFPPRNGLGVYEDMLPHIVLNRRTLPWERALVPPGAPPPAAVTGDAAPLLADGVPWVALLLFEEGEYTLLRDQPLEQVLPVTVFQDLGSPAGIRCDAVEAAAALVESILPSRQELQLLAHVRWVNVEDREVATAGGDGYFSVVVGNRLPSPGARCRAVLVSLEGRSDLVQENPPPVGPDAVVVGPVGPGAGEATAAAARTAAPAPSPVVHAPAAPAVAVASAATVAAPPAATPRFGAAPAITLPAVTPRLPATVAGRVAPPVRLVALTSWQFTSAGAGNFQWLMQGLAHDNALFGAVVDAAGSLALTDTGHVPMTLQDRAGVEEAVLYRGPLVPFPLTRDPLGPYHSADQARRVSPEVGAEDISYAAAFELGRLLGAADPKCAQALMQWRREAYRQSARGSTLDAMAARVAAPLPAAAAERLYTPVAPLFAVTAAAAVTKSNPPIADAYGLAKVAAAPGLDAVALAAAWGLATPAARALIGGEAGTLGAVVAAPALTARPATTLAAAAADLAGMARLTTARATAVERAAVSSAALSTRRGDT